ncbi:hypothetical protein CU098_000952, partial [Rhizopus stolonifer]
MSQLSIWQVLVMYFGSFFGSHVMISVIIVYIRRHYFSKRFEDILLFNHARRIWEANKRKFEKNVQEQPRKSIDKAKPLHRRLSFMSVRSLPYDQPTTRKKSFFSTRPLSTNFDVRGLKRKHNSLERSLSQPNINTDDNTLSRETTREKSLDSQEHSKPLNHGNNSLQSLSNTTDTAQSTADTRHISIQFHEDPKNATNPGASSGGNQGIAFAGNIERQREIARRRLEQGRRFDDILRITGDTDSVSNSISMDQTIAMNESDDEEMKRIMREPAHKSELTRQQRYRLGGAEYRALELLTIIVPAYYLFFIISFGFFFRIYVAASSYAQHVLQTSNVRGPVNAWLFSFFLSISAFNNLGLSMVDASMVPFQSAPCILILTMVLILAGNTAYAIFLRLLIWIVYKVTPKSFVIQREALRYLLDHPRRCYTTLFPSTQTKWLLIVLVGITAVEFTCFIALNYWLPVLQGVDWGARILDGLFQSVATRNAGFSVVDLMALNPGTQIVFIVAMYISVYPVAISMRNSNVYQERALGIYKGPDEDNDEGADMTMQNYVHRLKRYSTVTSIVTNSKKVLRGPDFFVMTQIQRQLTSEIFWVICCIFAICVIEAEAIVSPSPITISTVIYECVSAFGNVGASTGYPNTTASQAQQYHTLSKLVLILLMYRGRHR